MPRFLHVGCGHKRKHQAIRAFAEGGWNEATLDIDTPLYTSNSGPVSPIDVLYGFRPSMRGGNLLMAHHTGFTLTSLAAACATAGFDQFVGLRRPKRYDLWGLATKARRSDEEIRELGKIYLQPI